MKTIRSDIAKSFWLYPALVLLLLMAHSNAAILPDPVADTPLADKTASENLVLAGGCFWGMEAVYEHTKGVKQVISGYSGGKADTAHYEMVGTGQTGHAESVSITYDPAQITYGQLLKIYFAVAHDPTELNRQGPDSGTQYRSAIFYQNEMQEKVAKAYIDQLNQAKSFPQPVVTKLEPFEKFYPAEDYHQDYARHNPLNPYIAMNDLPKVGHLKELFPSLYRD